MLQSELADEQPRWERFNDDASEVVRLAESESFRGKTVDRVDELNRRWRQFEQSLTHRLGAMTEARQRVETFDALQRKLRQKIRRSEMELNDVAGDGLRSKLEGNGCRGEGEPNRTQQIKQVGGGRAETEVGRAGGGPGEGAEAGSGRVASGGQTNGGDGRSGGGNIQIGGGGAAGGHGQSGGGAGNQDGQCAESGGGKRGGEPEQ